MFSFSIRSLTWLSPSSLKSAEAKLANMVDLIGYPKLVLNNTWLDSVYSDVEVSDDDYLVTNRNAYNMGPSKAWPTTIYCDVRRDYLKRSLLTAYRRNLRNVYF